jgi:phage gp29-like protein
MPVTLYSQKSNLWREFYNPLHGLTIAKILSLLEQGERGQNADLQWFYYYMERTDPMIFSIIQRRKYALLDSDWDIRTVAPTPVPDGNGPSARTIDPVLASEQAALLTETYDGISNFRDALAFLFTSLFRG